MIDLKPIPITDLIREKKIYIGDGYRAKNSELSEEGFPFARAGNLNDGFLFENADCIPYSEIDKVGNKISEVGDIAFTSKGTIGRFGFVKETTPQFVYSPQICFWRSLDNKVIQRKYLYYWMNSYLFLNQVSAVSGQTDMAAYVNLRDQRKMTLHLPELITQQKIASILSDYDELIENNNQRIQLLEEMASEIYKEWFVRLRFPGYENGVFKDKDGKVVDRESDGALPDGWNLRQINDFGKVITGKTPSKKVEDYFGSNVPFIKTPDMSQGLYFIKTDEALSHKGANSQKNQYIPKNSICISCIGTVGKIGVTVEQSQTNQQINSLIPDQPVYLVYLYFTLIRMKPVIESYAATGATMANLSKSKFENLRLVHPAKKFVSQFHNIVNPFFEEIKILLQKNQVLQETRDLLLPRLISGKLSVEHLLNETYEHKEAIRTAAEPAAVYETKSIK
jgi:type I restriction enzyme S subunit